MSNPSPLPDPFEFVKKLWAPLGVPGFGPSMAIPTTNIAELDKRIGDLRSVEGWLSLNLEMVRTTIQGLEAQKATIAAFHSMHAQATATFNAAQDAAANFAAEQTASAKPPRSRKKKADPR